MPIHIPTIINELRENATEEQRKGLSILYSMFYECIELKKKLDIATKALEEYADECWWVDCTMSSDNYEYVHEKCAWRIKGYKTAQEALKEIDLVGTSAKEEQ